MSRVLVVGGGVFGVSAALSLRERGVDVTLCEQHTNVSPFAASLDISKLIRADYGDDALYTDYGLESLRRWVDLDTRWQGHYGRKVFEQCGVMFMTSKPIAPESFEGQSLRQLRSACGIRRLDLDTFAERFPGWKRARVADGYFNPMDGWARSGLAVHCMRMDAVARGVRFLANTAATSIVYESDRAGRPGRVARSVLTDGGELRNFDELVVCAGAWTPELVPETAHLLKQTAQPVMHYRLTPAERFEQSCFPAWSFDISEIGFYGFPREQGVVKVANHGDGLQIPLRSAGSAAVPALVRKHMTSFVARTMNVAAVPEISFERICWYCDAVNGDFLIDRVPGRDNVVVGCGGSGHAFKFGPVLGDIIADRFEGRSVPARFGFERVPERRESIRATASLPSNL